MVPLAASYDGTMAPSPTSSDSDGPTGPTDHDAALRQPHLNRMRGWRVRPEGDESLAFLNDAFRRDVARPFRQLGAVVQVWAELVPAELAGQTRLEGLSRGTLSVSVTSSAALYELDRRLRGGLERQLVVRHRGAALRRVKLRLVAGATPPGRGG